MAGLFLSLFAFLKCLMLWVVGAAMAGLAAMVNLFLVVLMALLGPLLSLLPDVQLSSIQLPSFLAWANWLFPLDQFVIATGVVLAVLVAWHLVAIGLRWLKVVE